MLRKSVRAFVEKEVAPHVDEWEAAGQIPKAFWRRLGELGFLGLEFPVEYGGAGGDFLSSVVLGEEMARCRSGGVAFSVLVHTDMSSPWLTALRERRAEAQVPARHHQRRDRLRAGHHRARHAAPTWRTSPRARCEAAITTSSTGSKIFITNGVYGDLYFVAPRGRAGTADRRHDGISMFLVERGLPGFTVSRKLDKMGMRASDTAELAFHDCPVPAENLLGVEGRGFQQLASGLQRERIMAAVPGAVAGAAQALEDTHRLRPRAPRLRRAAVARSRRSDTAWPTWRPRSRRRAGSSTAPPASTTTARTASRRSPW